jgi:BMFP domain-containing protein YqiC
VEAEADVGARTVEERLAELERRVAELEAALADRGRKR